MDFLDTVSKRQSCRRYDKDRAVEKEKLDAILEAARLSPSACNGQPYLLTVTSGDAAKKVAVAVTGMGMNKFATDAPIMIVISEEPYVASAALGARVKKNDYRSIDIGILASHITLAAAEQGLGSCIIGWLDDEKIRKICSLEHPVRLVISLGYSKDEPLRPKKRKEMDKLVRYI